MPNGTYEIIKKITDTPPLNEQFIAENLTESKTYFSSGSMWHHHQMCHWQQKKSPDDWAHGMKLQLVVQDEEPVLFSVFCMKHISNIPGWKQFQG